MTGWWQDIQHGGRLLRRYPGYAAVAAVALGLGIGATSAIFSIIDATLLRELPYAEPDRLVMVWERNLERGYDFMYASPPMLEDWRTEIESFETVGGFETERRALSAGEAAVAVHSSGVTPGVFAALGVSPRLGRAFDDADMVPGGPSLVILADGVWRARFGGDPDIVGRTVEVDGEPATVIGVMPEGFTFPPLISESGPATGGTDIWTPLRPGDGYGRGSHFVSVVARLAEGATTARAIADLEALSGQLARSYPATNEGWTATVVPLHTQLAGQSRDTLVFLLGAVGLVLLIACINVANLLLARGLGRRQEVAVRAAIGASRGRLVRQFVTESVLLGLVGGVAGLLIARLGLGALVGIAPETVLRASEAALDLRVVGFTLAVSLVSAIVFGLLPAWSNASLELSDHLREGGRTGTAARSSRRLQSAFIAGEIALSLTLLVGAGLLFQTFLGLRGVDPGVSPERTVTATVALPAGRYGDGERRADAYAELAERVAALPAVEAAGFIWDVPLAANRQGTRLTFPGETEAPEDQSRSIAFTIVTPGYFDAMGIPTRRGRDFSPADRADGDPVVVVNRALADRFFPGEDPIDERVVLFETPRRIVGVVETVRNESLRSEGNATAYLPMSQNPWGGNLSLVVRSRGALGGLVDAVREQIGRYDPAIPLYDVTTMERVVSRSVARERFSATLMGIFSVVALVLAGVGVFGVVSYAVGRRVREAGIRVALGASRTDVLRLLIGQSMRPVLAGVALGVPAALAAAGLLRGSLYGVGAADPLTFAGVVAVLVTVALVATWLPARRAMGVDPAIALRNE